jgi:hypothetical protein
MASSHATRPGRLWWIDAAGIGVCLLASAIGYAALVRPYVQRRAAAAHLAGELETRHKKVAELDSAVDAAQDSLTAVQQQLKTGAVQLEAATHINRRIAGVTEFFSRCELHVDDVQTGRVSPRPQYDLVPITLVGRGAHAQCVRLLHELCVKYPDMSVLRIDVAGSPSEHPDLEKLRFELFWYAAPSGPAPKAAQGAADGGPVTQS